jgi:histone-lysine N-methyltransferase SETD3
MAEGELMMTIPLDLCLTRAQAQVTFGKDVVDDEMDEYISISLLLMSEKLKGSNSRWKPYFDVLPDAAEVFPSYIWSDGDLEMLRGSPVFAASKSLRSKLEREYELLERTTFNRYPNLFPKAKFTFELFLWSFVMLFSRAARLSSKVNGEELALVPYADLMNHNAYSNTYIDAQRSGMPLISRNEEVALYSDRSYKKFEQVFINYGEKSNADLLLLYGFALERNPFNSVDISVGLSKEDPMYEKKRKFLDSSGRGAESVRFPLQASRYPSELVDFLRLLLVEAEDLGMTTLERMDFNEPISPSLERRVLQGLVGICESYLEKYPTTVGEDDLLIKDKNNFSLLSRQQVRYRYSSPPPIPIPLRQSFPSHKSPLQQLPPLTAICSAWQSSCELRRSAFLSRQSKRSRRSSLNSQLSWLRMAASSPLGAALTQGAP